MLYIKKTLLPNAAAAYNIYKQTTSVKVPVNVSTMFT